MDTVTVRVQHSPRGPWEVALPGGDERVVCETLEDARRVGYVWAAQRRPCELIVCDAYHRVLRRERLNGQSDTAPDRAGRGRS